MQLTHGGRLDAAETVGVPKETAGAPETPVGSGFSVELGAWPVVSGDEVSLLMPPKQNKNLQNELQSQDKKWLILDKIAFLR